MSGGVRRSMLAAALALAVLAGCSSDGSEGDPARTPATEVPASTATSAPAGSSSTVAPVDRPFDPATATAEAYADALDDALGDGSVDQGQIVVTGEQAVCIAPRWVAAIGVDTLVANEVAPELLADPGYRFGPLGLSVAQAEAMLDAFAPCGADLYGLFALALTPDQVVSVQTCAVGSMDHGLARTALISSLTGAPSLEDDLNALFTQVVDACQPEE